MTRISRVRIEALVVVGVVLGSYAFGASRVEDRGQQYMAGQVLVTWHDKANHPSRVSVIKTDRDVLSACEALRKDPTVARVQPNYKYHPCQQPNDPDFPDQYAHQLIEMSQAWEISTGSRGVVIAILGTGVEIDHPDLEDNIWVNPGEIPGNHKDDDGNGYVDDVHGWNFEYADSDVTPDPFSSDSSGHETMVAGVIGAVGNNDRGVTGVNWQCSMMVLRLSMNYTSSEIAAALRYAADNGAHVVNMSFGGSATDWNDDLVLKEAVDYAAGRGLLLVASAGNSDTGTPHYPAAYANVMAVSSTDGEDMKTGHSTYGPWVDMSAPGTDIMTTDVDGQYIATAGTSFSAPYVAAVAALVWSYRPELTPVQIRAILENTSDPVFYDHVDPNQGYIGVGRVNAYRALLAADQAFPLGEIVSPSPWQTLPEEPNTLTVTLLVHGQSYDLSVRPYDDTVWTSISQGEGGSDPNEEVTVSRDRLPKGVYEMRLTVTSHGFTHRDLTVFGIGQLQHQAHWPKFALSGNAIDEVYYYSPLCADITGNGRNEILQASLNFSDSDYWPMYQVNLWDANGDDLPGWPVSLDTYDAPVCRVGDIDGDGDNEIVAVCYYDAMVFAWHVESGEPVEGAWPLSLSYYNSISVSPALADLDGDGDKEILVGLDGTESTSDGLYAIQGDGTFLWQRRYIVEGPMAVADLDQDGDVEIALSGYGPGISNLYTYILDDRGQMVKRWRGGSAKGVVVADLNGDEQGNVVFCTEDSAQAVSVDGTTLWTTPFDVTVDTWGAMSVGDLDSDGLPEIFVSTSVSDEAYTYSLLYAFDHTGKVLGDQGFPKYLMGDAWDCEPLVADIDHDGHKELIAGAAGLPYMAWEPDGSVTPGFPMLSVAGDYWCTPAINDLDQDGDLEFMVPGYDYHFYVIDMNVPYEPTNMDWTMTRRDLQGSGSFSQALTWDIEGPEGVRVGETLVVSLADTVDDNLTVWFSVGNLPQGAVYDSKTHTIMWKPTLDQAFRTFKIQVAMTDGIQQISRTFNVTVYMWGVLYFASMDTDPHWQLDAGWSWGTPLGLGSWGGDPMAAFTGDSVVGFALNGDYANNLSETLYARTGPINCQGYENVALSFQRWLGIETPYDQAGIEVSNDGEHWTELWTTGQAHVSDQTWQHLVYTVPDAVARDQATVYLRWGLGPTDDIVTYPGWNLDDVMVFGDAISK